MICEVATEIVSTARGVSEDDMRGPARFKHMVDARWEAMWIIRKASRQSLPHIGRFFRRDHTTVLHSLRSIERRMAQDEQYRGEVEEMLGTALAKKGPHFYRHGTLMPMFRSVRA